jgi:hypothetical protein
LANNWRITSPFNRSFVITTPLTTKEENDLLAELLEKTIARKLRWGFQPPATVQTNIGNLHYVLRLRRDLYRLTARRDGQKSVKLSIERKAAAEDDMMRLYQVATGGQSD